MLVLVGLPMKEWNQGGTKLSEGQLFTFRDRQDSCLPSAERLDSPGDQGKGLAQRKFCSSKNTISFRGKVRGYIFSF